MDKSEKYYFICKRWKSNLIEIVHPRQLRNSDKVLFEANYDDWCEFEQILFAHNMNPRCLHHKKVKELWDRYYAWMSNGYSKKEINSNDERRETTGNDYAPPVVWLG